MSQLRTYIIDDLVKASSVHNLRSVHLIKQSLANNNNYEI